MGLYDGRYAYFYKYHQNAWAYDKKYRPYNMSIYIVLIYFLGMYVGFLEVPGPHFFARAPTQNKPLRGADSCAVLSAAVDNTRW